MKILIAILLIPFVANSQPYDTLWSRHTVNGVPNNTYILIPLSPATQTKFLSYTRFTDSTTGVIQTATRLKVKTDSLAVALAAANAILFDAKQNTLVSGTNIKTVNGNTILGSGDLVVSGSGGPTFINLASNFSSTSTTPATVTGWSFAVTTGKTYRITVIADYQTAATTTGGIIGISLTTATGSVRGYAMGTVVNTAAASDLVIPIRAISGAGSTLTTTGVTAASSPHYIGIDITFTCTNTGTFNIVWATEVAASAAQINANSSLIYQALN